MGGDFQASLTFGRKSQGVPLALSLITLKPVSGGSNCPPFVDLKPTWANAGCVSCSLVVDSSRMTKGRSNHSLLGLADDGPAAKQLPWNFAVRQEWTWIHSPTTWRFA